MYNGIVVGMGLKVFERVVGDVEGFKKEMRGCWREDLGCRVVGGWE